MFNCTHQKLFKGTSGGIPLTWGGERGLPCPPLRLFNEAIDQWLDSISLDILVI